MICPKCNKKLPVIDSRLISSQMRRRKYVCKECGLRISTKETIIETKPTKN